MKESDEDASTEGAIIEALDKQDHVADATIIAAILYTQDTFAPRLVRRLFQYFDTRIRDCEPYSVEGLVLLTQPAFAQMVENKKISANQAFGLTLRKGKYPRTHAVEQDIQAAALMLLELRKGKKLLEAQSQVAELIPRSESSVGAAYYSYRGLFDQCSDERLSALAESPFKVRRPPENHS